MSTTLPVLETLGEFLEEHSDTVYPLLRHYLSLDRHFLLQSDLWDEFEA